jgi:hypothetical protein
MPHYDPDIDVPIREVLDEDVAALRENREALERAAADAERRGRDDADELRAAAVRARAEVTPPPDPAALAETIELDGLPEGNGRRLLELEGFNVVRTGAIRVLQSLAGIPLETLEATIAYNQSAAARLKAAGPTSRDALAVAERELEYLRLVTRHRRELKTLEERLAARDRIVAR